MNVAQLCDSFFLLMIFYVDPFLHYLFIKFEKNTSKYPPHIDIFSLFVLSFEYFFKFGEMIAQRIITRKRLVEIKIIYSFLGNKAAFILSTRSDKPLNAQ